MGKRQQDRLLALYEKIKNREETFEGDLNNINYYNLMCKAGACNTLDSWSDMHVCGFKYNYKGKDSVLMILSIPIDSDKESSTSKNIAERIMGIVKDSELCFTTLDFNTSTEVKNDKYIYITLVKIIEED